MKVQEVRTIRRLVDTATFCNKCGGDCTDNYASLVGDWGYGSKYDREFHVSHFCESCYDEFLKGFIHPPEIDSPWSKKE